MQSSTPCAACGGCTGGNCPGCGGCAGTLYLTEEEVRVLRRFGEIPFWPLVRRADAEKPSCPEPDLSGEETLNALSLKGLVRLDEDLPLTNYAYSGVPETAHRGSAALTAAGQRVLDLLDIQGVEEG